MSANAGCLRNQSGETIKCFKMKEMEIIVFTNGCFDIIHPGHIDLLKAARSLGTKLIVGINSDRSVREIKGFSRPLLDQESRVAVLRELRAVDEVLIFDENTPERIIKEIQPQVLVKGGDWQPEQIIGADFVLRNGGKVFSIPFRQNISTSQIIEKMNVDECRTASRNEGFDSTAIEQSLKSLEMSSLERGAKIIAETLAAKNEINIVADSAEPGAHRLAESLKQCCGSVKILSPEDFQIFERGEKVLSPGDLLIVAGNSHETEKLAGWLIKNRQAGGRTIIITAEKGRKLAALSDVCVMLNATSGSARQWQLAAIEFIWCRMLSGER